MRRVKPHQVVLAVGALVALFTLASGVVPALTHWHDHSTIRREVFINVPTAMKVAFYAAVSTMLSRTVCRSNVERCLDADIAA